VSDANRDCAEQAGDKCVYDCISNGVLTSSVYLFKRSSLLASHLAIRSSLSSNALSVRLAVCLSLCFRFSWRHLGSRGTDYSRCTSCGFNLLTSRLSVRKSLCLLGCGQVAILFLWYSLNLLLKLEAQTLLCFYSHYTMFAIDKARASGYLAVVLKVCKKKRLLLGVLVSSFLLTIFN